MQEVYSPLVTVKDVAPVALDGNSVHVGGVPPAPLAQDEAVAGKLWEVSEQMTGQR